MPLKDKLLAQRIYFLLGVLFITHIKYIKPNRDV